MLLAHYVSWDGSMRHWTLPGGGVEHGEDPRTAVVREVAEETGYEFAVERLLGVDSRAFVGITGADTHAVGVFYRGRVVGGELRDEVGGSTDTAAWLPVDEIATLPRAVIVDVGLDLYRTEPADGHVAPVPAGGLLRQ
jgi:ADP-ribose pyrophosphatase YjhB (NUDIX family)